MERVPRALLALTVIVVVVALYVGIKDYSQQKNSPPPVSTSTPTVVDSNSKTVGKKTISANTRRTRLRATEADSGAKAPAAAADASEKSRINEESNSGVQDQVVHDNALNAVMAADAAGEAAMGQDNRVRNKLEAKTAMSALTAPQCAPLPNVTNPEDVDAHYYRNWAREYWCDESARSSATRN